MSETKLGAEVDFKVLRTLEEKQDDTITLSTGVVLRGKQVPAIIMVNVLSAFPRPKPPVYFDKNMGREMENPDDPRHKESLSMWQIESSAAMLNTMILLGTELVSVPTGTPKPEDSEWLEDYSLLGLPMRAENRNWRYLRWVMFKAAINEEDLNKIKKVVGRLSGIPEKNVKAAEEFLGSQPTDR